ncbi:MAG: FAD-binding protein [Flavobacteriaceae bacterium]|nr:FAD-binding protein [Flavobacteriaceae bacterium]
MWEELENSLDGELHYDKLHKSIYATDASVYRKIPQGVIFPKNEEDLKKIILFAKKHKTTLIPRAAGTSLAGQCVGDGIVVDISKHFNKIISVDALNETVTLQPGVIRDDLNRELLQHGLFFGPNTSTSNRCTLGGMVGNNSSGTTSIQYGVTRDKVIEIKALLSDSSEVVFNKINKNTFLEKCKGNDLEAQIYKSINDILSNKENQKSIVKEFPKKEIHRRCTGYAIDELLDFELFSGDNDNINLSELLCGSEGTLAFTTEITLKLDKLKPAKNIVVAVHYDNLKESLESVNIAMKHNLYTCELMDKIILDCTKNNREQSKNRFFLEGDPEAILMLEIASDSIDDANKKADILIEELKANNMGYSHPKIYGKDISKLENLRKAGLGLLGNLIGDRKAVACIEDTAVTIEDLPDFINEFSQMMAKYKQEAVYYAHAGAGEIHMRPILNLKKSEDVALFRTITTEVADLVKKYGGSFSGEHGDGIVRAEFLSKMIGEKNYNLLKDIKKAFDPNNIFNKGKITDAFAMDESLRYEVDREEPVVETIMDFSDSQGILSLAEKCNGSGDCRKSPEAGGVLCPSYRASRDEKDTTRARANALREFLTNSEKKNKFAHPELKEVFDLCLSCKACASECPSGVDIASMKAEFLYQYQLENGFSLRNKLFAYNAQLNKLASIMPRLSNYMLSTSFFKNIMGVAKQRQVPKLSDKTFFKWYKKNHISVTNTNYKKEIYLFCDEFTNYYDTDLGKDAVFLLEKLGYKVNITKHKESARSFISKGFLKQAKDIANYNINFFKGKISKEIPLVGLEPSAILTFRDEYLRLADDKVSANKISEHSYTIEEFIASEIENYNINESSFTHNNENIKIHAHCHQKALSTSSATFKMLNIPKNYSVSVYNSGCCGMAGSFGYEKEHYKMSIQVGEDTLFGRVRNTDKNTIIAVSGTSCRHQIKDGTQRESYHPVSVLRKALI